MKKILSFLSGLLAHAGAFVQDHVQPAIDTVERIKSAVDSPEAFALTAIIPGELDDAARAALSAALGTALAGLQLPLFVTRKKSIGSKLEALVEHLDECKPDERKAVYSRLASLLAQQGAPEGTDGHLVDTLVQMAYSARFAGTDAAEQPAAPAAAAPVAEQPAAPVAPETPAPWKPPYRLH